MIPPSHLLRFICKSSLPEAASRAAKPCPTSLPPGANPCSADRVRTAPHCPCRINRASGRIRRLASGSSALVLPTFSSVDSGHPKHARGCSGGQRRMRGVMRRRVVQSGAAGEHHLTGAQLRQATPAPSTDPPNPGAGSSGRAVFSSSILCSEIFLCSVRF